MELRRSWLFKSACRHQQKFSKKRAAKKEKGVRFHSSRIEYALARERILFGTLGAASPVKKIDPDTGEVVALIDPNTGSTLPMDVKQAKMKRSRFKGW